MIFFGPISSIFDFATFGIMIWVFNAHAPLFRSGWFVESLATQSLIIFAIRTRRVAVLPQQTEHTAYDRHASPASRSALRCRSPRWLTYSGSRALPASSSRPLAGMIVVYLVLIELGKRHFYRVRTPGTAVARRVPEREHWIPHRASRWSTHRPARRVVAGAKAS